MRHLRPRGEGVEQPITTVELFFDLVYLGTRLGTATDAPGELVGDLRHIHPQQEGTS